MFELKTVLFKIRLQIKFIKYLIDLYILFQFADIELDARIWPHKSTDCQVYMRDRGPCNINYSAESLCSLRAKFAFFVESNRKFRTVLLFAVSLLVF